MTDIKFCGITRPSDAQHAAKIGARFVGAILTESPRQVSPSAARDIYAAAGGDVGGVAVFRYEGVESVIGAARESSAGVIQVHRELTVAEIESIRAEFDGEIWTVVEVAPGSETRLRDSDGHTLGDGVMIDAAVRGKSGGTGMALNWRLLADASTRLRRGRRFILAGGLTPGNVADAVVSLDPDVVDVSSGVESAPGIKDHQAMEQFALAAFAVDTERSREMPRTSH